ncbi:MAG: response regulator [Treponema sp.]|jgi:signal transduction histidine kinase/CheY-like chemotaxis protein/HPt (histidine-containing phosphotransfer) domain-containing protein|nr:response regulator [Treponema sp.]
MLKKILTIVTHVQVLVVIIAFSLMVFFSYYFMSDIERKHLLKDVNNAISNVQVYIESDLMEPETALGVFAEVIQSIILHGASPSDVNDYIIQTTDYLLKKERNITYANGIYGCFPVFDGLLISGIGWVPPDDFVPEDRPWYKVAVEANGKVGITEPYLDMVTNTATMTFSRCLFGREGQLLGVICVDVMFDRIMEFAVNAGVSHDSYGILLDSNFRVIAHPVPAYIGKHVDLMNDGDAIREELMQGKEISERPAIDHLENPSVLFARRLNNGWYMGIIAYSKSYYKSVNDIGNILVALGIVFAAILSGILIYMILARKRAEERIQIMTDATPLGITMWDENINLIDLNYEAARVLGIYSKEKYRQIYRETVPEFQEDGRRSTEVHADFISTAFKKGENHTRWVQNSIYGEKITFDASAFRLILRDKPVIAVYCRDIRDLDSAIAKIREADECRETLFDTTPLGSFMIDSSLKILECNQEIVRLLGIPDKQTYIDRFLDFSPEYQPDGKLSSVKRAEKIKAAFEEGYGRFEWQHRKLSGEIIPCEITLFCVMFKGEKMICGYTRDLRELKSMMAKMREADECTQVLFDATPLSSFMIDRSSKVLECNQEVVKLLGLSDKQEYIDNVFKYFPEYQPSGEVSSEYVNKFVDEAFEEGSCRFEWMHQKMDGEQIPTEVTLVRVKFRGEYMVAGYIRDLRELKTMITEMRRAEVAEESSKAKSDFLAKMSHEIRTPMNAILGITEIQLQDDTLPLVTKEALERIYNSGDLLLGIINDILDLSKIESGKFELVQSRFDIASLIYDTVKLNVLRFESKPIDFKLFVSEDMPQVFLGDELRIKQILNNLLTNAFKYTDEGQVELRMSVEPLKNNSDVKLIFRVSDTGQGMTAEQLKRLGDKFSRFNLESNRKTEGTGLGMNITQNLIQLMNGEFHIESTPGMGSTFTVRLPLSCDNSVMVGKELAESLMKLNLKNTAKMRSAQIKQEFMPYGRVLVVDDVETNLYVARGLMAPYGLSIDTAESGFETINRVRGGSTYDIIFMDHMMPGMDGIEAAKILRNMGYKKPIVALTANALAGQAEIFMKNGFDDFISKPIDIRQLNAVLNKMIRDKQTPEVLEEASKQRHNLYATGKHNIAIEPQLAEFFVRDAKKAKDTLIAISENNCRRSDDIPSFIINVHAIKSALANVGEGELSSKAMELEQAGREQNINLILSSLPAFLESLQNVIDKLKPDEEDTGEEGNSITSEDQALLTEKLLAIQDACASLNKKAAKDALACIKEKSWPRPIREKLSALAEHLLHSEFEEAAGIAKEING